MVRFMTAYCPYWVDGKYIIVDSDKIIHVRRLLAQDQVWCTNNYAPFGRRWVCLAPTFQDTNDALVNNCIGEELIVMDQDHLKNLLKWLRKRAARFRPWWRFWEDPSDWLERQPLVRRLKLLISVG